jgi:hypothetical protein
LTPVEAAGILGDVQRFSRVLAVLLLVLATAQGNVAMCAGWKPTPEARRACCAAGAICPMRPQSRATTVTRHAISQQAADACCAAAAGDDAPPAAAFALPVPVAIWAFVVWPADPRLDWLRAVRAVESPPSSSGVPRHLLLSVILI